MYKQRYFFLVFIFIFTWNGKNRGASKRILQAVALFEKVHIDSSKLRNQMNEIENYNIKMYETSLLLHEVFKTLRADITRAENEYALKEYSPDSIKKLKKVSTKKDLMIIIRSFRDSFEEVHENLTRINKKISRTRKLEKNPTPLKYASKIFKDNLVLSQGLARLTLARSLFLSQNEKRKVMLKSLYKEIYSRVLAEFKKDPSAFTYLKEVSGSCYDLDSATIFAPQAITRLRLLSKNYLDLLNAEKQDALKSVIEEQKKHTSTIDKLEGCLDTYVKAYEDMTTYKITRVHKFSKESFKIRKKHLKEKMETMASTENRVRDTELEKALITYYEKKSLSSKCKIKKQKYNDFAKKFKGCLELEDDLFGAT